MEAAVKRYGVPGMVQGSLAYDLAGAPARDLGRGRELDLPHELPREKTEVKRRVKARQNISAFAVLGYVTVTALMILLIFSYVRLFEMTEAAADLDSEYSRLKTEHAGLLADYESRINLNEIENKAVNELGMMKPREGQIVYVDLSNPDESVVIGKNETQSLGTLITAIKVSIEHMVEYFR